ncbi:MAG: hypothetical protein A2Y04_00335 [Omnitrophica WOR_2 bacterium GWC2_45_7]|nr:MAG: hypothetical protein A2Y04_00335 [Omnitrophica WOR_2 bacterium GWC2_45_7]
MINKISVELTPRQIEEAVDKLSLRDKVRIVRKLERQTLGKTLDTVFKKIDQRRKQFPISQREINEEIAAVRKEIYGKSRR